MGDPLADRYRRSFVAPHPWRSGKPPFRIPDSVLKDLSRELQHLGVPLAGPSDDAKAVDGVTPGTAVGALMRMLGRLDPASKPPPDDAPAPAPASSQMEGLRIALKSAKSPLLLGALSELDLLWRFYEQMVHEEYLDLANVKKGRGWWAALAEFEERGGERLYAELRPVYFRAGIREPVPFIKQIQSSGPTVAGVEVQQGVHPEFAKLLKKADGFINRSTAAQFGSAPVKYIGCFRPSALDWKGVKYLSNHMIGAAVDIDASRDGVDRNPHLKGPQIPAVDAVLAFVAANGALPSSGPPLKVGGSWLTAAPVPATDVDRALQLYQQMLDISLQTQGFLNTWLGPWLTYLDAPTSLPASPAQQQRDEAFRVMENLAKAFGRLDKAPKHRTSPAVKELLNIQKNGFISIPADIFVAMLKAGLQSGLEYTGPKDTMHFEIKNPKAFIAANVGP